MQYLFCSLFICTLLYTLHAKYIKLHYTILLKDFVFSFFRFNRTVNRENQVWFGYSPLAALREGRRGGGGRLMMIRSQAHEGQRGAGWRAAGGQVVVFKQHAVVAAVQTRHLGHGRKTTIARTCKIVGKV